MLEQLGSSSEHVAIPEPAHSNGGQVQLATDLLVDTLAGEEAFPEVQRVEFVYQASLFYRCFELLAAITVLILMFPLLIGIALVLLQQRMGSVFYSQIRVGQGG